MWVSIADIPDCKCCEKVGIGIFESQVPPHNGISTEVASGGIVVGFVVEGHVLGWDVAFGCDEVNSEVRMVSVPFTGLDDLEAVDGESVDVG